MDCVPTLPLPVSTESALAQVRARLEEYVARCVAGASGPESERLWRVAGDSLRGGKLVRPAILLVAAEALDGEEHRAVDSGARLDLAVAVELLHSAFLLHDDVIDHDVLRRGEPNLIGRAHEVAGQELGRASHRRLGEAAGILAADVLLADAHQLVARLDVPHDVRLRMLDVLGETLAQSVAGELADVLYSLPETSPDVEAVLAMSARKTGVYTVRLPLLLALAVAGARVPTGLEEYCTSLGLAFQLQDDVLGVFGDPEEVGKDPYSDIREGKVTALVAWVRAGADWPRLASLLGRGDLTAREAQEAVDLIESSGARAAVEQDAAMHLADALAQAARIGEQPGYAAFGAVLEGVARAIAERRS
ncbi:polyprenyl synthetase family protein [Miniimonas arenae]|uniref:Polyprenyl synthetase family protein n=1 Tax=Miniimonas arenae TaxID=676201 RepID=A0A5C5BCE1_9MICO|nr:polyprenyl synthetase family protein [Miniimonas arenae]